MSNSKWSSLCWRHLLVRWWPSLSSGGVSKTLMSSYIQELLKFQRCIKITPFNVWLRYFVWNFKGPLWNSIQNILSMHWKMCILFTGENLRARKCFWNTPLYICTGLALEGLLYACSILIKFCSGSYFFISFLSSRWYRYPHSHAVTIYGHRCCRRLLLWNESSLGRRHHYDQWVKYEAPKYWALVLYKANLLYCNFAQKPS